MNRNYIKICAYIFADSTHGSETEPPYIRAVVVFFFFMDLVFQFCKMKNSREWVQP